MPTTFSLHAVAMPMPLVAVPAYHLRPGRVTGWLDGAAAVPTAYTAALGRAGVRPAILVGPDPGPIEDVLAPFDGVVLLGGGDVNPELYHETPEPEVYGIEPDRDALELELARRAVAAGVPLLAVCRGVQVLNVALGGTLIQHLPDRPGTGAHGRPESDGRPAGHAVAVEPGSRLAAALGGATALPDCVSIHHQAADTVAPGLLVTGRSADGVVEALETSTPGWVLGVQWHPERTAATDPWQQAIFNAFALAVRGAPSADNRRTSRPAMLET
jgi:putative glutamine amidotransferase